MIAQSIFELQANLCQAMSNPVRIHLVHLLREGPRRVGDLVQITGIDPATVSRNLGVLKSSGILAARRDGKEVCDLMRQVLAEQAEQQVQISKAMEGS